MPVTIQNGSRTLPMSDLTHKLSPWKISYRIICPDKKP